MVIRFSSSPDSWFSFFGEGKQKIANIHKKTDCAIEQAIAFLHLQKRKGLSIVLSLSDFFSAFFLFLFFFLPLWREK
jgi:hypothetical protein